MKTSIPDLLSWSCPIHDAARAGGLDLDVVVVGRTDIPCHPPGGRRTVP